MFLNKDDQIQPMVSAFKLNPFTDKLHTKSSWEQLEQKAWLGIVKLKNSARDDPVSAHSSTIVPCTQLSRKDAIPNLFLDKLLFSARVCGRYAAIQRRGETILTPPSTPPTLWFTTQYVMLFTILRVRLHICYAEAADSD